jgi:DNA-binding NtrC family response regulator
MMTRDTIIYVSDTATGDNSVLDELEDGGYQVARTSSSTQAIALLFVLHATAAVVLDQRATEYSSFDLALRLRAICPEVPIVLLCREHIEHMPSWVDACVNTREPLHKLTSTLRDILNDRPPFEDCRPSPSFRRISQS